MALLYAGIDEAGYGPMLGPMCVGRCVLRVENWAHGSPCTDVWAALASVVTSDRADGTGRIAIADSKRLKLGNQLKTKHPLVHLERGVLSALASTGWHPTTEQELFESLDISPGHEPWSTGVDDSEPSITIPIANDTGLLAIDASRLRDAMHASGITLVDLSVEAIPVPRFNDILARAGSKSALSTVAFANQLRAIAAIQNRFSHEPNTHLRVVGDRLGARRRYADLLASVWTEHPISVIEESDAASRYAVGDRCAVLFRSEAEDAHWPVALASMAAKLARELAMARFNRYWSARMPELRPTAGYVQDARRWLDDASDLLTDEDRRRLIRNA